MKRFVITLLIGMFAVIAIWSTRIVVLSDLHVVEGNECDVALRQAVSTINGLADVELVVVDGDMTNEGSDAQIVYVKNILDSIIKPLVVIPGNHENNWSQSATTTFPALFGDDRFITTLRSDSLVIAGLNCGPYMKMGDGHIKQEDLHWLDATLNRLSRPGVKVLNFCHYPLNGDLDNAADYERVLSRYPVLVHINGHYHAWQKYRSASDMFDCVSVRALEMKNDKFRFGFTILDVEGDSLTVSNMAADGSSCDVVYDFVPRRQPRLDVLRDKDSAEFQSPAGWNIEKIWTDSASIFTRLAIDSDNIYFSTSTGFIKAINKDSGMLAWQTATSGRALFSKPTVACGKLFVPTTCDGILVVNTVNGLIANVIGTGGMPVVADGLLYNSAIYQGGMKTLRRINPQTENVEWSIDSIIGNYCQAMPSADGRDLFFGAWDSYLYCVDTETGSVKWRWNNGREVNMLGPGNVVPVVTRNSVVIVAPDRYMTAIDRKTGKTLWRDNSVKYRESLGVSPDSTIAYAKTMDGELIAVDISGEEYRRRWIVDMGIGYDHAPCIIATHSGSGCVIAGSRRGIVTAINPETQALEWQLAMGKSEINGFDTDPVTGDIYVSLIEGTIWKISKLKPSE